MYTIENDIGTYLIGLFKAFFNTFFDLWKFLSTPIMTLDLRFLANWDFIINKFVLVDDLSFLYQVHDINLFFFLTTTGILILIIFKTVDLIIPV